jgi:hypothetical protein
VLFLRGTQLVLRSSFLTVLDLDEVNVILKNAEIFGSVPSGEGESARGWGAAEVLPVPLNCPLPLLRTQPPSLLFCICGDGCNQYSIRTAGGKPSTEGLRVN